jgi:hypothetical protein
MLVNLTWEEFEEQFKPVKNGIDAGAPYDGYLFETYGQEMEAVRDEVEQRKSVVWTLLSEGETTWISEGFHFVNRQGYFITSIPYDPNTQYVVDKDTWSGEDG